MNAYEAYKLDKEREARENPRPAPERGVWMFFQSVDIILTLHLRTAAAKESKSGPQGSAQEGAPGAEQSQSKPFDLDAYLNSWMDWAKNFDLSKMKMPSAHSVEGLRYYAGGFEDKMSRREAAQVLGVRYLNYCRLLLKSPNLTKLGNLRMRRE